MVESQDQKLSIVLSLNPNNHSELLQNLQRLELIRLAKNDTRISHRSDLQAFALQIVKAHAVHNISLDLEF